MNSKRTSKSFILSYSLPTCIEERFELMGIVDDIKNIVIYFREIAEVILNRTIVELKSVKDNAIND